MSWWGGLGRAPRDPRGSADRRVNVGRDSGFSRRSPAAEAVFRSKVEAAGVADRFHLDSAGTIGYHSGHPADRRMRAAGAERGYNLDSISRQVRKNDFEKFDHIIAMDMDNLHNLQAMAADGSGHAKVTLMCDFARNHSDREVPDPYYGDGKGFEHVMDLLEDACDGLLEELNLSS